MPTKPATQSLLNTFSSSCDLYVASVLQTHTARLPIVVRLDNLTPAALGDGFGAVLLCFHRWAIRRFGPQGWHLRARYANGRRVGYELRLRRPGGMRRLRLVVALILRRAELDERLVCVR